MVPKLHKSQLIRILAAFLLLVLVNAPSLVIAASVRRPSTLPLRSAEPNPSWSWRMPQQVVDMPVLLYHHVNDDPATHRYGTDVASFRAQMQALKERGYVAVTFSQMINALRVGGPLPDRPVVISFDDGDLDVFENAFPIMQEYGFIGTLFVVSQYLNSPHFVSDDQVRQLIAAGWEIGSHSVSHADLVKSNFAQWEVETSRERLQAQFGVPVNIIAYPYGSVDGAVFKYTMDAGYTGGAGLGVSWEQSPSNLYYINRIEIKQDVSMERFNQLLPW